MKIKQKPEDFSVKESWRFDEVETGKFRVYLMDKQKLSTFEAVDRIRQRFGLRPGAISFCGLKDKQGRTEQLIAVDGADVDLQDPDLRLKFLGRTDRALSAANTTSNRFSVTVRALTPDDLTQLNLSAAEVNRLGVVNYFDSQRFGALKHGQGFIAKDIIRGDFEAALKNYMAKPSPLDKTDDAKIKDFWRKNWGDWDNQAPFKGNAKYYRILQVLRDKPRDFVKAFLQIESNYRALILFEYQSYLWNEGVRRLMAQVLPREALFPAPYQAGTLLFHRDAPADVMKYLRGATFPLLAPNSTFTDPKVKSAVEWVLGKEKLKLEDLRIEEAPRMLFFKHEERPVLDYPDKLVLGRPSRDEVNKGFMKLNVAFTLPPGAYATLVIKRLFHFSWQETPSEAAAATAVEYSRREMEKEEGDVEALSRRASGAGPTGTRETGTRETGARPAGARPTGARPTGARPTGARPTGARPTGARPTGARPTGARPTGTRAPSPRFVDVRAAREAEQEPVEKVRELAQVEKQAPAPKLGFRDTQKLKKEKKAEARAVKTVKSARKSPRKPAGKKPAKKGRQSK